PIGPPQASFSPTSPCPSVVGDVACGAPHRRLPNGQVCPIRRGMATGSSLPLGQAIRPDRTSRGDRSRATIPAKPGRSEGAKVVIQLSCIGRAEPGDLRTIVPALAEAAAAVDLDHSRLAAVLDWVQYRRNFRAPVMARPFGWPPKPSAERGDAPLAEI